MGQQCRPRSEACHAAGARRSSFATSHTSNLLERHTQPRRHTLFIAGMRLATLLTAAAVGTAAGSAGSAAAAGPALPPACLDSNAPQQLPGAAGTLTLGAKQSSGGDPLPADMLCWWEIPAPAGSVVKFDFSWVDLGAAGCDPGDSSVAVVQVYDSTDPDTALSSICNAGGSSARRAQVVDLLRRRRALADSNSVTSPHTAVVIMETPPKYNDAYGFEVKYAVVSSGSGGASQQPPTPSPGGAVVASPSPSSSAAAGSPSASAAAATPTSSGSAAAATVSSVPAPPSTGAIAGGSVPAATPSASASAAAASASAAAAAATPSKSPAAASPSSAAAAPSASVAVAPSSSPSRAPPAPASSPSASSSPEPDVVLPSPPAVGGGPQTASLTIPGINSMWAGKGASLLISGALGDLCAATGAETYRFTGFTFTPAGYSPTGQRTPPKLSFQVLPPAPGRKVNPYRRRLAGSASSSPAEDSAFALVNALYTQLQDPDSVLRAGTVTKGFTADPATVSLAWTAPASVRLTPDGLLPFKVPYGKTGRGAAAQRNTLTLTNTGGAPLVITAMALSILDTPYPSIITSKLLALDTSSLPSSFPVAVAPGASVSVAVVADPSVLPVDASSSVFGLVSIDHNVPDGPHAVGVSFDVTGGSGGSSGGGMEELANPAFRDGALTGLGAAVAAGCILSLCIRRCNKKRGHPSNSISSSTEGSKSSGGSSSGSGHVAVAGRGGRISLWDLLFSRRIPYARAPGGNSGGGSSGGGGEDTSVSSSSSGAGGASAGGVTLEMRSTALPPLPGAVSSSSSGLPSTPATATLSSGGGISGASTFASPVGGSGLSGGRGFVTPVAPTLGGPVPSPAATVGAAMRSPLGGPGGMQAAAAAPASATPSSAARAAPYPLVLRAKPVMKAAEFESRWASLSTVDMWGATMLAPPGPGQLEGALAKEAIACMASGVMTGVAKYYFYAQEESSGRFCMAEVSLTLASLRLSVVLKAPDASLGAAFLEVFKRPVKPLLRPE